MKKSIIAMLLTVLMLLSLVACNPAQSSESSQADQKANERREPVETTPVKEIPKDGEPDKDGFLNSFIDMQPTTLDPAKCADAYGVGVIMNTLEPLIRIKDNAEGLSEYAPAAAESWDISDDQLTYTFHLREAKWTDGQPLTSKDFAFAMRRGADPNTANPYANFLFPIENAEAIVGGEKKPEELGVSTPDDKTLVVKLAQPLPYFLDIIALRCFFPQREDLVEKYGDSYATSPETSPCCGPFKLDSWTINASMTYVRNEDYWDAEHVQLKQINVKIIQDLNTIYNALESGEIDSASVRDAKRREVFKNDDRFYQVSNEAPSTSFVMMNNNEGRPTANVKIRQALAVAIDRQEMIDATMDGVPVPAYEFVPKQLTISGNPFNTEEGQVMALINEVSDPKALFLEGMKEAGLGEDPAKVTIRLLGSGDSTDVRLITEFMQQNLEEKLGCKVEVENLDWNSFFGKAQAADFDMAWLSYGAQYNDPSDFLNLWESSQAIFNLGWQNAEYDELVQGARTQAEVEARAKAFHRAEEILIKDEAIVCPLTHPVSYAFVRKYVRGVTLNQFNTRGDLDAFTTGRQ